MWVRQIYRSSNFLIVLFFSFKAQNSALPWHLKCHEGNLLYVTTSISMCIKKETGSISFVFRNYWLLWFLSWQVEGVVTTL